MNDSGLLAGRTLILIKHALPEIDPERPAPEWHLGDTGRAQAETLAEQLRAYAPQRVLTSVESKAHETGEIVANQLGLTCDTVTSIHE
jgi:broad specificity phosphatase PhoE